MSDHAGFLRAIRADPDDDTPRLVYADWLEEQGEAERAEFIRLQCEADRLGEFDPRGLALDRRADAILARHESAWLGDWADRLVRWTFRRGFLDAVALEPGHFLDGGEDLFARFPVRRVGFESTWGGPPPQHLFDRIARSPTLALVRSLDASPDRYGRFSWNGLLAEADQLTDLQELILSETIENGFLHLEILAALCGADHLSGLEILDLGTENIGDYDWDEATELLARATFAGRLTELVLDGRGISDEGAQRLAGDPAFERLERLRLGSSRMTEQGAFALLASPRLKRLRDLCLGCAVSPATLSALPRFAQLRKFDLWPWHSDVAYSPATWHRFASSPGAAALQHLGLGSRILAERRAALALLGEGALPSLRSLSVRDSTRVGDAILKALAGRPEPGGMTSLELVHCDISLAGVELLAGSPLLSSLGMLRLSGDNMPQDAVSILLNSPHLSRYLSRLDLVGWDLRGGGFHTLADCDRLAGLQRLDLAHTRLDAAGMNALLESPYLQGLQELHLGSEQDGTALRRLAESGAMPRLRTVVVGSRSDARGLEALRRYFGPRLIVYSE